MNKTITATALMLGVLLSGCGEEPKATGKAVEAAAPEPATTDQAKSKRVEAAATKAVQPTAGKSPSVEVNPLTGEKSADTSGGADANANTKSLNLSLTDEERLGGTGAEPLASASGVVQPGAQPVAEPVSAFKQALSAKPADDEVSLSGGLLTKENEPDYRDSVEGAQLSLEVKY